MFWNATNITDNYLDLKDLQYSMALVCGSFKGGYLDLPYLNTLVQVERGDLYLLHSNKIYHNVDRECVGDRHAFIFTNHKCVIQRFCAVDVTNMYNKWEQDL